VPIVLAFDAAWGGLGVCLCTANAPIYCAHHALKGRAWRMAALIPVLRDLELRIADLHVHAHPSDPAPRVLIEKAPQVYAGRGNQAATAYSLGHLAGALELWACRPTWSYPWAVPSDVWRSWWWKRKPRGRKKCKIAAYNQVHGSPWRKWIDGLRVHDQPRDYEGPAVDVAEAILIGMGAARRLASPLTTGEAPAGPAVWSRARRDGTAHLQITTHPQLIPPISPPRPETTE